MIVLVLTICFLLSNFYWGRSGDYYPHLSIGYGFPWFYKLKICSDVIGLGCTDFDYSERFKWNVVAWVVTGFVIVGAIYLGKVFKNKRGNL